MKLPPWNYRRNYGRNLESRIFDALKWEVLRLAGFSLAVLFAFGVGMWRLIFG